MAPLNGFDGLFTSLLLNLLQYETIKDEELPDYASPIIIAINFTVDSNEQAQ